MAVDGSRILGDHDRPTQAGRGADSVLDDLIAMAQWTTEILRRSDPGARVIGVGAGAPGPLDTVSGVVRLTPNLGWTELPLRQRLADGLDLPAAIDNDANCAILGEAWVGAARNVRNAIGMTIGTGIGGGLILDGQLYHGASDCAGEIGHVTVDMNGRRCGCGNYGCLEAYASGTAIATRAIEQIGAGETSSLLELAGGDINAITAATVFVAAREGDEVALELVRDTAHYLGTGVAMLINIFNPQMVVILGGVTQAGETLFFEPLRREVSRRAFKPAVEACQIVPGTLDGLAGVYGAARIFLDQQATLP